MTTFQHDSAIPTIAMNDGYAIPQLGYGVFKVDPDQTADAVAEALEAGYRHIDTAEMYHNEAGVGEAIRRSGIDRAELFITSKLDNPYHAHDDALAAFDESMTVLGLEYLDLFLVHWPMPAVGDYVETWQAMVEMQRSGRVRSIGVSNFQIHHLERVLQESEVVPAVNQIEIHPYLTQEPLRAYHHEHGIVTQAWSPLAKGMVAQDPVIGAIAERLDRTPAQVTLRWHVQRGDVVFPKSISPQRMRENLNVFDFELSADDMAAVSGRNRDERTGPDPDQFNRIRA